MRKDTLRLRSAVYTIVPKVYTCLLHSRVSHFRTHLAEERIPAAGEARYLCEVNKENATIESIG